MIKELRKQSIFDVQMTDDMDRLIADTALLGRNIYEPDMKSENEPRIPGLKSEPSSHCRYAVYEHR